MYKIFRDIFFMFILFYLISFQFRELMQELLFFIFHFLKEQIEQVKHLKPVNKNDAKICKKNDRSLHQIVHLNEMPQLISKNHNIIVLIGEIYFPNI